MPLDECMESHTEFQLRVRLAWLELTEDEHSLTDHYLAALRADIATWALGREVTMESSKLRKAVPAPADPELVKAVWRARLG